MNIVIAFILGMLSVIVFAAIVMGVIAFFKVIKLKNKLSELEADVANNFSGVYDSIQIQSTDLSKQILIWIKW